MAFRSISPVIGPQREESKRTSSAQVHRSRNSGSHRGRPLPGRPGCTSRSAMPRSRKPVSTEPAVPDGRVRAVIEGVEPDIDAGKFPAKGVAGDRFIVECDAFADGHDQLRCLLLWRAAGQKKWQEVEMTPLPND